MTHRRLPATLLTGISFLLSATSIFASANHLVISEVQTRSIASADDEFVELYNPTNASISLEGLRLRLNTSSNLIDSMTGSIPSHGFYLVAKPGSDLGGVIADAVYSASSSAITSNSAISLLDTDHTTIIDRVGIGTATLYEASPATAPISGGSIERKANSISTTLSMSLGGVDYLLGNGEDTDNNSLDFIQRDFSQPQNSLSAIEPALVTPTPTATPTATPTNTPTPIPTITPTIQPTPTLIPTATPTIIPTITPTPIPTLSVTPTPTTIPTPLPTNSPEPTFTPTTTPTPTPSEEKPDYFHWHRRPVCTIIYVPRFFFHRKIYVPQLSCHFINRWGEWSDWDN